MVTRPGKQPLTIPQPKGISWVNIASLGEEKLNTAIRIKQPDRFVAGVGQALRRSTAP